MALLVFVAAVTIVGYRTAGNLHVPGEPLLPRYAMADFRDNLYYPVVAFLDGMNPYDPAVMKGRYPIHHTFAPYSPLVLLVHLPLGLLPIRAAELLYFAVLVSLSLCVAALSLRICGLRPAAWSVLGLAAVLLLTRPGESTVFLGHYTLALVAASYLALAHGRTHPGRAAAGLALATMKPTFGLPLALLLIPDGAVRTVVLGIGAGGVLTAIPTLIMVRRAGGIEEFLAALAGSYRNFTVFAENLPASSVTRIDTISLVSRLTGTSLGTRGELAIMAAVLTIAALSIRRLRRHHDPAARHVTASISCLTVVCCVYHHAYDALILALPLTVLVAGRIAPSLAGRGIRWILVALLSVPMINYVSTYAVLNALNISGRWLLILTSLNGAALTAAWFVLVWVALRWPGSAARGNPTGAPDTMASLG